MPEWRIYENEHPVLDDRVDRDASNPLVSLEFNASLRKDIEEG